MKSAAKSTKSAPEFQDYKAYVSAKMGPDALLAFTKMPTNVQDDIIRHFLNNAPPADITADDLVDAWLAQKGVVILGFTRDVKALFAATMTH